MSEQYNPFENDSESSSAEVSSSSSDSSGSDLSLKGETIDVGDVSVRKDSVILLIMILLVADRVIYLYG